MEIPLVNLQLVFIVQANNNIMMMNVVTSFSVAVAVDKKAKILCGQLSNRCTTCRRFD